MQPKKPCQMCNAAVAVCGEKYCKNCKRCVLAELKAAGYLTETRPPIQPTEQRGRRALNPKTLGGSAELGTDGDE